MSKPPFKQVLELTERLTAVRAMIAALEAKIAALEARNAGLEARNAALETRNAILETANTFLKSICSFFGARLGQEELRDVMDCVSKEVFAAREAGSGTM